MAYQSKYTGLQIDDILDSVEWKQDKIEDLASIRAGAQKGATALQSYTEKYTGTVTGIKINGVVKSGSGVIDLGTISTDISGKQDKLVDGVNIATVNGQSLTEGGDLTIESGANVYELDLTGRGNYDGYITEEEWNIIKTSDRIKIITDVFSTEIVQLYSPFLELNGDIAAFGSMMGIQGGVVTMYMFTGANTTEGSPYSYQISEVHIPTQTSQLENDSNFVTPEDVAAVALSGSYNDLHDTPSIPAAVTESTVSGWGFTKNAGTVTGVKINGTTKNPSSGVVDLGTVITDVSNLATKDEAILKDATGELVTAQTQALYGGGLVYALPDQANGDEDDVLLSRSSVKTINGESIVGRGDITISGGSSEANVQAIIREEYSELETDRSIRDAKDLTTGELIYFTGNASHIVTPYGGALMDYIDDGDAQGRIYRWNVEAIDTTDEEIPGEVMNIMFSEQGMVLLNGAVANFDFDNGLIYSSIINDGVVTVTKVFTDFAFYQSVVINEYNLNGSDPSGAITSIKIDNVSKSPSSGVVDLGYVNKQLSTSTSSSMSLSPNIYYRNTSTSLSSLTITLGSVSNSNIINEYFVEFTTSSTGTTVSLPSTIKWANGEAPTFEASTTYQISIVNNLGTIQKFK